MDPLSEDPAPVRITRAFLFVASAAFAAAMLRFAWHKPWATAGMLGALSALIAARWISQRKLRSLLRSGDVIRVLERWSSALRRVPHPETMAPLMTATAFAANGWVDQAREAMAAAERGPAWEAALEHRLFLDTMLLAFEGDREGALEQADRLERLPLPPASEAILDRVKMLRSATGALARAFARQSRDGDRQLLEDAGDRSPLVFWAMRYAAAVVAVDRGEHVRALSLLDRAPRWPEQSSFRAFHEEILRQIAAPAPLV
ncbi:MAG: hypothetical protein U0359_26695 [Byssovorax sp.]